MVSPVGSAAPIYSIWAKTLSSAAGVTALSFVTSIITARMLGPDGRGMLAAAMVISGLASGLAQLGLGNTFIYLRGAGARANYKRVFVISNIAIGILAGGLSVIGATYLFEGRLATSLPLVSGLAISTGTLAYCISATQTEHSLTLFNTVRVLGAIASLACALGIGAIVQQPSFSAFLFLQSAVSVLSVLYVGRWMLERCEEQRNGDNPVQDINIISHASKHYATALLGLFLLNFDKVALIQQGSVADVGHYVLAFGLSRPLAMIQDTASTTLFSRYAGRSSSELKGAVESAFRMTFVPMLIIAAAAGSIGPFVLPRLLGQNFQPVVLPFSILCFEAVIGGASWTLAQRFNASGRPGLVLLRQVASVLPMLIAVPFIPKEHTANFLAALMLLGAALRLVVTLSIYPAQLKEPMPPIYPARQQVASIYSRLFGKQQ